MVSRRSYLLLGWARFVDVWVLCVREQSNSSKEVICVYKEPQLKHVLMPERFVWLEHRLKVH